MQKEKVTYRNSFSQKRRKKIGALWLAPIFLLCITLVIFTIACRPYIDFGFSMARMFLVDERLEYKGETITTEQGRFPSFGEEFGKIIIDKIGLISPLYQGDTEEIISKGSGHFYGSALPGEGSNVVISAHRNTQFANLGELTPGDQILLDTVGGKFVYEMVDYVIFPDYDEQYILPTETEVLTLLTCYPFDFIGAANDRYIVRCKLISGPENAWGGTLDV
ncbi:MAG: class D sortase [Eubacteriaceae bacterium]